jgi:hypothetical protein
MTHYTFADLKSEFRISSDGDDWGNAMHWWFAIAGEIHEHREWNVPDAWRYRPGLSAIPDATDYAAEACHNATDDALTEFGALIHRYARALKRAGKSY